MICYLEIFWNETHLRNVVVNKVSSVNKGITKTCLIVDMVKENWLWIAVAGCPNTELFLVLIFLHSDWIWRNTEYLSVFSPNTGKYGPEITLYLDTFRAACFCINFFYVFLYYIFYIVFKITFCNFRCVTFYLCRWRVPS